jgi:hypothetical protein
MYKPLNVNSETEKASYRVDLVSIRSACSVNGFDFAYDYVVSDAVVVGGEL